MSVRMFWRGLLECERVAGWGGAFHWLRECLHFTRLRAVLTVAYYALAE